MSPNPPCILCQSNARVRFLYAGNVTGEHVNEVIFSARRAPDRLHGDMYRCAGCGLTFTFPLLAEETLRSLYTKSSYTYAEEETYIGKTYASVLRSRVLPILVDAPKPWSFLDIGCGNGFMLRHARELGFSDVWGIEPSTDAIAKADPSVRDFLVHGMFSAARFGTTQFDLVTCFQALDHMPDPISFVRECRAVLKPGGVMLCINHNIGSWTARLLGERCPMIDIEHTFLHTPGTMCKLFAGAGFDSIRTFSVRNDYPLQYWIHLLPVPAALRRVCVGILQALHLQGVIVPLYAGNLGMTALNPR